MAIQAHQYNKARSILALAGSMTASKSHQKHGKGSVPVGHGVSLIQEAIEEFQAMDAGNAVVNGMTADHAKAVQKAAKEMGLTQFY